MITLPNLPDPWKYLFASIIGGLFVILANSINNNYQLKRDEVDWQRNKLWNTYEKIISNLIKLNHFTQKVKPEGIVREISQDHLESIINIYAEILPQLYWLLQNHPDKQSIIYRETEEVVKKLESDYLFNPAQLILLKEKIINLMKTERQLLLRKTK